MDKGWKMIAFTMEKSWKKSCKMRIFTCDKIERGYFKTSLRGGKTHFFSFLLIETSGLIQTPYDIYVFCSPDQGLQSLGNRFLIWTFKKFFSTTEHHQWWLFCAYQFFHQKNELKKFFKRFFFEWKIKFSLSVQLSFSNVLEVFWDTLKCFLSLRNDFISILDSW